MIIYTDKVINHGTHYEVTRTHSDGVVATYKCGVGEVGTKTPIQYLDRLLSQHLSGTGVKREAAKTTSSDKEK